MRSSPQLHRAGSVTVLAFATAQPSQGALLRGAVASTAQIESDARNIDEHPLAFTVFPEVSANNAFPDTWPWKDVVKWVENPNGTYESKGQLPLVKLATFGDKKTERGSLRSDDNLLTVTGVEGDYDGEQVPIEDAAAMLTRAGIEAVFYTTARHTRDKPRWRVMAPLARPCAPSDRARFAALLNGALGGILAKESFTASQSYYFGRVTGVEYETRHVRGTFIDAPELALRPQYPAGVRETKPEARIGRSGRALEREAILQGVTSETIVDLRAALWHIDNADRPAWVEVIHALKDLGENGETLAREFSQRNGYPFDEEEFQRVWDSAKPTKIDHRWVFAEAQRRGWRNPRAGGSDYATLVDRTDVGNANLLVRIADGNLRWVSERQCWLWWNGEEWAEDDHGVCGYAIAVRVAEHYANKAAEVQNQANDEALDDNGRKKIADAVKGIRKWEAVCRSKRAIDAMLAIAQRTTALQVGAGDLNCDPWLLGVRNGVIDLRSGNIRPAAREDLVTRRASVPFNPDAKAPRWSRFIREVTSSRDGSPRPQLAAYLQRMLGYLVTGTTREQKLFLALGTGSNGKNILLDTVQRVAGAYWVTMPAAALMTQRNDDAERASPITARLAGARAAISAESRDGQKLDVALVKLHSGGGSMIARYMRENPFSFEITHKLVLMTNHRPALDHLDDAMRGRLHIIPFDRTWNRPGHPERDPALPDGDPELMAALRAEDEGILCWLIEGAAAYCREGLIPPPEVVAMTREYFQDQDDLGRWLEEYERCDPKQGGTVAALLEAFGDWCGREGVTTRPDNPQAFARALTSRGYEKVRDKSARWVGLRARSSGTMTDDD